MKNYDLFEHFQRVLTINGGFSMLSGIQNLSELLYSLPIKRRFKLFCGDQFKVVQKRKLFVKDNWRTIYVKKNNSHQISKKKFKHFRKMADEQKQKCSINLIARY